MFCSNCGKELPSEAKFCVSCGAKVASANSPDQDGSNRQEANSSRIEHDVASPVAEAAHADEPLASEASAFAADTQDVEAASMEPLNPDAQTATDVHSQAATAEPETGTLKAAVAQNKKRSRRRLPMIVLVALALALATSVAFAAHYVYTNVWLPAHQEQPVATNDTPQETTEQPEPEPVETVTYTSSKTFEYVNVPADPYGSPGVTASQKWSYDQLTSDKLSTGAQAINNRIKTAFNATKSKSSSYPSTMDELDRHYASAADDDLSCVLGRDISISYFKNDIVGVFDSRYATNFGGSGGWPVLRGAAYNIDSGEAVTPQAAFGLTTDEAIAAAESAVRTYLQNNPSTLSTSEACKSIASRIRNVESSGLGEDLEGSSCLALTESGLVYLSGYGELGSYSYGAHAIVIASDNNALIGTEVSSSTIHGIE